MVIASLLGGWRVAAGRVLSGWLGGGGEGSVMGAGEGRGTHKKTHATYRGKGGRGTGHRTGDRRLRARPATKPTNGGVGSRFEFEFEICTTPPGCHTKLNSRVSQSPDVFRSWLGFFVANPNPD